jgi:protein OS-9
LCHDVAFLPPKEKKANPITCSLIVEGEAQSLPQTNQGNELTKGASSGQLQKEANHEKVPGAPPKLTVGGIVIGGRRTLSAADEPGKPMYKLENPRKKVASRKSSSERLIEMIAQAASKEEGGKVEVLSAEDLERLEISPEVVEELKQQLEEMAGDQGWKLEIVEVPGGEHREIRGYVDKEQGEEDEDETSEVGEGSEEGFKEEL